MKAGSIILLLIVSVSAAASESAAAAAIGPASLNTAAPTVKARLNYAISVIKEWSGESPKDISYIGEVAKLYTKYLNLGVQDRLIIEWAALEQYLQEIVAKDSTKGIQSVERVALHFLREYRVGIYFAKTTDVHDNYKREFEILKARAGCSNLPETDLPEEIDNPDALAKAKAEAKAAKAKADKAKAAEEVSAKAVAAAKAKRDASIGQSAVYTLKDGRIIRVLSVTKNGDVLDLKDTIGRTISINSDDIESIKNN